MCRSRSETATGSETLTLTLVPTTVIPQATPVVDGKAEAGEYPGPTLDLGRIWQGAATCTGVDDCGVSSTGEGSTAKVSWSDDALYFFIHVRDDYQSYAVTPAECVGHWQADSVEILLDPRGTASQALKDTANTFKLGIFPFSQSGGPLLGTGCGQPSGLLERFPRHRERTRRAGRVDGAVGRQQRDHGPARVRRWRLRPRGEDPAGGSPGRGRPVPPRPEHHAVRQRRHLGGRYDDAAAHRHEYATGLVGARHRFSPTRTAGVWPRSRATPHPRIVRPPRRRRTSPTRTSTALCRRRPSPSPPATAYRSPAASPRPT